MNRMFDYIAFKKYLDDNGYKQKYVAQKANINEANFSAIVTGKNKCSLENYVAICQVLQVKFGTFINADELQTAWAALLFENWIELSLWKNWFFSRTSKS